MDCKHCEILEYGYSGRLGQTVLICNICEEDNENKEECFEQST